MKLSLIAVVIGLAASPVGAKDHSWPVGSSQYHVYFRELDVKTLPGRAAMLARVEVAASKLCAHLIFVDRAPCVEATIRETLKARNGATLQLALNERAVTRLAAR